MPLIKGIDIVSLSDKIDTIIRQNENGIFSRQIFLIMFSTLFT